MTETTLILTLLVTSLALSICVGVLRAQKRQLDDKLGEALEQLGSSALRNDPDSRLMVEDALDAVEAYIFASSEEVPKHELYKRMIDEIMQARRDVHGWE